MNRSTRNLQACVVAVASGMVFINAPALAGDVFNISQPTHAIVDNATPVYPAPGTPGDPDTSNTFHTGYIYNIFGAANPGVEGTGDMIFHDGFATDFVDFHTATLVDLTSVGLSVGSESTDSNGPRGYLAATFQQYTNNTYSTPVGPLYTFSNSALVPAGTYNNLPVSINAGQYFQLSMTTNATYGNGGVRVSSFTGTGSYAPEPSSFVLCGLGALGLFVAARRRRKA